MHSNGNNRDINEIDNSAKSSKSSILKGNALRAFCQRIFFAFRAELFTDWQK
jgi:hypothetical protein